jgi:hypothetical protein
MEELKEVVVIGQKIQSDDVLQSLGVSSIVNPDDYFLQKVEILTSIGPVNIKGVMVELSYYEDIFKGTVTGSVLIHDAISLIDRLALNGTEILTLSYKKSSQANIEFNRTFRIFRVGERILNNNAQEVYALHFCSEELFLSEQIKISKAYSGKKINEIITDILENEMKAKRELIIEPTLNVYDFIIPYKKPYEAINWLANYAQPTRSSGADFVFFENVDGLNFRSLQSLYSQTPYRTFTYNLRTAGKREGSGEVGNSLVGIKSYNFLDTFDTLYATNLGAFSNKTISIDPLTRKYYTSVFNYYQYLEDAKTLNGHAVISQNKNALGKAAFENEDAVLKVLTTNKSQKKAKGIADKNLQFSVANDVGIETYVPYRTAQLALSHYSRIKIAVSGDPLLSVGQTLNIILPSMRSSDNTGYQEGKKDEYHSGKYIVTAVRHIIDVNLKYETILEIAKDTLGAPLPFSEKSTAEILNPNSDPSEPVSGGILRK